MLNKFIKSLQKKLHYYFLAFSIIYGFLYMLIIPPMYHPDEIRHFQKSISKNLFIKINGDDKVEIGAIEFSKYFHYKIIGEPDISNYSFDLYSKQSEKYLFEKKSNINYENIDFWWQKNYPNINYLSSRLGIEFSRFFSDKIFYAYYFGKLFNLIFCSILIFFALKNSKQGKEILFILALMPMSLSLFASFNQDSVIIAYTIFLVFLAQNIENRSLFSKILFFFMLLLVSISKISNILFIIIFFIFLHKKNSFFKYLFLFSIIFILSCYYYKLGSVVESPKNLDYLLNNIFLLPYIVINDLVVNYWTYSVQFVGYLGWISIQVNPYIVIFFICSLFLVTILNFKYSIKNMLILFFILLSVMLAQTVVWIFFSPRDEMFVDSLQGRYFIPLVALIGLTTSKILKNVDFKKYIYLILFLIPHFNLFVINRLILKFYN